MPESLLDRDTLIYREMMTHTPLFAHRNPRTIAIIDEHDCGITQEILKHTTVQTVWQMKTPQMNALSDERVHYFEGDLDQFLMQTAQGSLDILIIGSTTKINFSYCAQALHTEGVFIQLCESFFDLASLKNIQQQLKSAGFADALPLNFPQSNFTSGWRAAVMATREGIIQCPREKDIFNKTFTTNYYNLDMHKAAFALPEFMREEFA